MDVNSTPAAGSWWTRTVAAIDRILAPIVLFIVVYVGAMFLLLRYAAGAPYFHWIALASVVTATAAAVLLWDRGRWPLGLVAPPGRMAVELAAGVLFSVILIGAADVLILLTTGLSHGAGTTFPWSETLAVFLPAVLHEELLFRGYPFQRLWRWRPWVAITIVSLLFAFLHAWNDAVTPLALLNIFLGGVLLSLAYARFERLWLPIGLHLGWNLMTGPILGYEVSGYVPEASLLRVTGGGPAVLTGGAFGIEGSIWMTVVETGGIVVLGWKSRRQKAEGRTLKGE